MIGLTLAASGILCATPSFWSLPVARLHARSAGVDVARVNAIGNLGSFVSPFFIGYTRDLRHSTSTGFYSIAAALLLGAMLMLAAGPRLFSSARDNAPDTLNGRSIGGHT